MSPLIYVAIDYHKKYSQVEAMNSEGEILSRTCLRNDELTLKRWFSSLGGRSEVVLEACRNWQVMYEALEAIDEVEKIHLANPYKVRAIAEAKIKTDAIDAHTLAHLLRCGLIPAVYVPSKETRKIKEMLRQRMFLVRTRTRLKNRIHALLDRYSVSLPSFSDPFGRGGLTYLRKLKLPYPGDFLLAQDLKLLEALSLCIREVEKEVMDLLAGDERFEIAQSLPGLGPILAGVTVLEIDRVERFSRPEKLVSYAGLVPSTHASGDKVYHGHLIKQSNKWLRWAMVEASWSAQRSSPYCYDYYRKYLVKGHNTAIVALARRMLEILWHLLTERRFYEERPARFYSSPPPSQNFSHLGSCQG